jgi:hypothetical protein
MILMGQTKRRSKRSLSLAQNKAELKAQES